MRWLTLGFEAVFDGTSLEGWRARSGAEDSSVTAGPLVCAGWLGTADAHGNLVLKVEFRDVCDCQPAGYNTGSLVNSLKAEPAKILADEWNRYGIRADGDRFVILLNGKAILDGRVSKHSPGRHRASMHAQQPGLVPEHFDPDVEERCCDGRNQR